MTPATAPGRSREQRLDALAYANAIRSGRAELKRRLYRDRYLDLLQEVIRRPRDVARGLELEPGGLDTMKVLDALLAVQKIGRTKAHRLLACEHVSPSKTLAGLSDRQRGALLDRLARIAAQRFHDDTERTPA